MLLRYKKNCAAFIDWDRFFHIIKKHDGDFCKNKLLIMSHYFLCPSYSIADDENDRKKIFHL